MADLRFPASRSAGLDRLADFVPRAGTHYATGRNTDPGPGRPGAVSRLSAYLRYRLVSEEETVAQVLDRHSPADAEKFVQEVLWRSYWKGWLEMRPAVWQRFLQERDRQRQSLAGAPALADAELGATGIEGFDDWARELVETGYLHNHSRMWFASIWIFTLRLPWVLGADFFLRHLIDADPASNTLSWRWVAGLQTSGKTYLATADNIARYTNGRFAPRGLAREAVPLEEPPVPSSSTLLPPAGRHSEEPSLLLITHEDMSPETLFPPASPFAAAVVCADPQLLWGEGARAFVAQAAEDTAARMSRHFGCPATAVDRLDAEALAMAARAAGVRRIVTPYAPVGPVADALAEAVRRLSGEGIALTHARRSWDDALWPHAKKGFFAFKEKYPGVLREFCPA